MKLSKQDIQGRSSIRSLAKQSEWLGHVSAFPIKFGFKSKTYMAGNWGTTEIKGLGKNKHIEISLGEDYMKTPHGRELCMVIAIHELAHALTWSANEKVEDAKSYKYGDHGPEFGIVYAQLWSDVMDTTSHLDNIEEEHAE